MIKLLDDHETLGDATRAFIVVALGRLGDQDPVPAHVALAEHTNGFMLTEALRQVLSVPCRMGVTVTKRARRARGYLRRRRATRPGTL